MEARQSPMLTIFVYALLAALVAGQCQLTPGTNAINLRLWTDLGTESVNGVNCLPANWVYPPGVDDTVEQHSNTCGSTHLVSDFAITSTDIIRGTLTGYSVNGGGDDDYIGFNIGMDCGTSPTPTSCTGSNVVSIVWAAGFSNANSGLCFSRRNFPSVGICPWGCIVGFPINATLCESPVDSGPYLNDVDACRDPNNRVDDPSGTLIPLGPGLLGLPVYANPAAFHAAQLGGTTEPRLDRFCEPFGLPLGWVLDRDYDFIIQYTPTQLRVFVDFVKVIDYSTIATGEPQMSGEGRITLMNNSQGNVRYSNMQILDSGTHLCNNDPWQYDLPVETCGTGSVLRVDWGDGSTPTDYPVNFDQTVTLSHVFATTPTGFYQVTANLVDNGGTVRDTHGLLAFILDQPEADLSVQTNGQCGFPKTCANDGEIFLSGLTGGVSPYDVTFSTGDVFPSQPGCSGGAGCALSLTGLPDGVYSVDMVDSNGCAAVTRSVQLYSSSVTVTSIVETSCGNVQLNAFSTCEPLGFSWTTSDGSGLNPSSQNQSGLSPGTYDVLITDPNGCTNTASITVAYGITNVSPNDVLYMYMPRPVRWTNFVSGTNGDVRLVCPSSNTLIYSGDLSRTQEATITPFGIVPENNCVVRISGSVSGCNVEVGPVHLCAHPGIGDPVC